MFFRLGAAAVSLGLLTNVLVAWGLARWRFSLEPDSRLKSDVFDFGADSVAIGWYFRPGSDEFFWQPRSALNHYFSPRDAENRLPARGRPPELDRPWKAAPLPTWIPAWTGFEELQSTDRRVEEVWVLGAGWPLRSLACTFVEARLEGKPWRYTYTTLNGIGLPAMTRRHAGSSSYHHAALPLRPVWAGIVVNSLVYAAAWTPLLLVPTLRRRHRVRHGRCPACGYYLGPDADRGCPECGRGREPNLTPA